MMLNKISLAISLIFAASSTFAASTDFDNFTPMTGDVGTGTLPESAPYKLSFAQFPPNDDCCSRGQPGHPF